MKTEKISPCMSEFYIVLVRAQFVATNVAILGTQSQVHLANFQEIWSQTTGYHFYHINKYHQCNQSKNIYSWKAI